MPALSQTLVSILESAMRAGATRVEASGTDGAVRLVRGDAVLGKGQLPSGAYPGLTSELRALGARDGDRAEVTVHSPVGPLKLAVELAPSALRIFFPHDAGEAEAEAAFSELVGQLDSLGADRVECKAGQASFLRGAELVAVAPMVGHALALLVTHARTFVADGEETGGGVLMGTRGAPRNLRVELRQGGVAFSVG